MSRVPLPLLHALGWLLGWLSFAASPMYRRRFLAHVAQAGYRWIQVRGAVGEAGKLVLELPRLWLGAPVPLQWVGSPCIDEAHRSGRGLLFLTPHMGCFEVTAQGYAHRYGPLHGAITVLYRPPRKIWLRRLVEWARPRPGLATAPATLRGVRQMLAALKAGQAVGLLPDQVPPHGLGVNAPFFGRSAYTMTLGARLAQQTGAAVLLAWGERLPWGRGYRIHVQPLDVALSADSVLAATQLNACMEGLIRSCPQQYLWGYARYKLPVAAAT